MAIILVPRLLIRDIDPTSVFTDELVDSAIETGVYLFGLLGLLIGAYIGNDEVSQEVGPTDK